MRRIPDSRKKKAKPRRASTPASGPSAAAEKPSDADAVPAYAGDAVYIDRELSWLAFNRRVLEEANDPEVPLLERLRFLSIVGSNLDEFFEVRVAALLQRVESGVSTDGIARLDARAKLERVLGEIRAMTDAQYACWDSLQTELGTHGVRVKPPEELTPEEDAYAAAWFRREARHLLTPIVIDPSHPFPRLLNKALCLAFRLKAPGRGREVLGVMTVPRSLPRVIALPSRDPGFHAFVFTGDLARRHAGELFRGYAIRESAAFRVTRNSNLYLDEDEERDEGSLLETVEEEIRNRRRGDVVRLEIEKPAGARLTGPLTRYLDLDDAQVFHTGRPVNLSRLSLLHGLVPLPALKFPSWRPALPAGFGNADAIYARLRAGDVLLHHPFESFDPVVRFVEAAARDPQVQAVKATLYRTSADSPIMFALMEAAEQGKEVTAVVELKARFDEQRNIQWARQLEERGGTVVYGLAGLKTHCKIVLALRREVDGFRRYAHIGTGNYNPDTARAYTDFSLLTADPDLTGGVSEAFHYLTAGIPSPDFRALRVAPLTFLSATLDLIRRERENARAGRPAGIVAKVNALYDREVIQALYAASSDGVPVKLVVRGICALRPGVPGLSQNIRVKSVVGRFLEHSRVFCFRNGGEDEVFVGSGDWMTRNLRERVEVMAPVRDPALRERLERVLSVYWADVASTRWMRHDGVYERARAPEGGDAPSAQDIFLREAAGEEIAWRPPGLWDDAEAPPASPRRSPSR